MRVFVSVDIEEVRGIFAWSQCGGPNANAVEYVAHDWPKMHVAAWSIIFGGGIGAIANR